MRSRIPPILFALAVFSLLSASALLHGQRAPDAPNEPKDPEAASSSKPAGSASSSRPAGSAGAAKSAAEPYTKTTTVVTNAVPLGRLAHWLVRVFYVDGRMTEGVVALAYTDYIIDYTENGNRFYKRLTLAETASIRVNRWKPMLSRGDEKKALYFFMPDIYRVIARDGEVYRLEKRMMMLDSFELRTSRGNTRVYSYFADYWSGTEDDGEWENSGSREFDYNDTRPHPGTVYRIDFISEQTS